MLFELDSPDLFDVVMEGKPTTSDIAPKIPYGWLNCLSGEIFYCTNNTPGSVVWVGQVTGEIS